MATAAKTVEKLFSNLAPSKLADLVFSAIANQDNIKCDYVESCVPMGIYRAQDWGYRHRLHRLMALSTGYAFFHWQLRAKFLQGYYKDFDYAFTDDCAIRLVALESAINEIALEADIDVMDIKRIATSTQFDIGTEVGDPIIVEEYKTSLWKLE